MEIKENELKQQEQFHGALLQQKQQMEQMHLQQQQAMNMAMMSTLSEMLKLYEIWPSSSYRVTQLFPIYICTSHVYTSVHV